MERLEAVDRLLKRLGAWAARRIDVRGVGLVGAWARGKARMNSPVEVVLLTSDPARYLEHDDWVAALGMSARSDGRQSSDTQRQIRFDDSLELQLHVAPPEWASTSPLDPTSVAVAGKGLELLYDPLRLLRAFAHAINAVPGPALIEDHPSLLESLAPSLRICEHNAEWAGQARHELARLKAELGDIASRLEHVGSTAVPGLAARPIIDLQLSVADASDSPIRYVEPLARLGYLFIPDTTSPDCRFFAKPSPRPRSHHVYVCQAGSEQELSGLAVRDFLRAHPSEAREYEDVKRALATRHAYNLRGYTAAKTEHLTELQARAERWASSTRAAVA